MTVQAGLCRLWAETQIVGFLTQRLIYNCVSDPFSVKRNVARTLFSVRIFDYLYNCLRKGCLYFSLPTNQADVLLSSGKSKDKSQQLKSGQKQTHSGKATERDKNDMLVVLQILTKGFQ